MFSMRLSVFGQSNRGFHRLLAIGLAGSMVVTGLVVEAAVAAADVPVPPTVSFEPPPPAEAADEATAMDIAMRYRTTVEILDRRTESSQTFARPDGTLRSRVETAPQRVRRGDGWVPIDTHLKRVGDDVVPEATTLDMRFSGGGAGPMVVLNSGSSELALDWVKDTLPEPRLGGNTAKYYDVLPGVDLLLTAKAASLPRRAIAGQGTLTEYEAVVQFDGTGLLESGRTPYPPGSVTPTADWPSCE